MDFGSLNLINLIENLYGNFRCWDTGTGFRDCSGEGIVGILLDFSLW